MKNLIKKILKEYKEEEKILVVPSLKYFGNDWNLLQLFLNSKGNPKWKLLDDLDLDNTPIESLGNLQYVGGGLYLGNTPIKSLGNLQSVEGNLYLNFTPLSEKYTEEEIGQMVNVKGVIFM